MIADFDLGNNEWLATLYEDRHRWVPVFVKHNFWAGMSTTQRSESMNAFFDGYVHSRTTLKQFVEHYEQALKSKMKKEYDADFASLNSLIPTITSLSIEKQFQNVYTNDIFKKFQDELRGLIYCNVASLEIEGSIIKFQVTESKVGKDGTYWKKVIHDVTFDNVGHSIKCICRKFEYMGILCKHSIAVLIKQKINEVPACYILERWRKDIKRGYSLMKNVYDDCSNKEQRIRNSKLRPLLFEVQQLGEQSDQRCNSLIEILSHAKEKLLTIDSSESNIQENEVSLKPAQESGENGIQSSEKRFLTPVKVKRKGRQLSKRKESKEEKLGNGRKKVSRNAATEISKHVSPSTSSYTGNQVTDCYVPSRDNDYIDVEQNHNFASYGSLLGYSLTGDESLEDITTLLGSQRQLQFE